MSMTRAEKYDAAVKRITDSGGEWPPRRPLAKMTRWQGTGRYTRPRCVECGYESRPLSSACELCGERLHAGS